MIIFSLRKRFDTDLETPWWYGATSRVSTFTKPVGLALLLLLLALFPLLLTIC